MTDPAPWDALAGWYDRPWHEKRVGAQPLPALATLDRVEKLDPAAAYRRHVERVLDDVAGIVGIDPRLVIIDEIAAHDHGRERAKQYDSRPGRRVRKGSKP